MQINEQINGLISIIRQNEIQEYHQLIDFFSECKIYEPDDFVDNPKLEKLTQDVDYILSTDYDFLYNNAIKYKDFLVTYIESRKNTYNKCKEQENILDLIELIDNHNISDYKDLVDFIIDAMCTEPDDPDVKGSSEAYESMLFTLINKQEFFKEHLKQDI